MLRRAAGSSLRVAGEVVAEFGGSGCKAAAGGSSAQAAHSGAGAGGLGATLLPAGNRTTLLPQHCSRQFGAAARCWRHPTLAWQPAAGAPPPRARLAHSFGSAARSAGRRSIALPPAAAAAAARGRWVEARRRLARRVEWVLGRGYHAREAFFNAVYMQVEQLLRRRCLHGQRAACLSCESHAAAAAAPPQLPPSAASWPAPPPAPPPLPPSPGAAQLEQAAAAGAG
jgi:hypothetical protein